jgi:tetratricopeptide (TPR) repeat protein
MTTQEIAHFNRGEYVAAEKNLQAAVEIVSQLPRRDPVRVGGADVSVAAWSFLENCLYGLGRLDEALEAGLAAERAGRLLDDPFLLAWALVSRCRAYANMGNHNAVLADAQEMIAISRERGFTVRVGNGLIRRGISRAHLGELDQGIEDFREGSLQCSPVCFRLPSCALTTPHQGSGFIESPKGQHESEGARRTVPAGPSVRPETAISYFIAIPTLAVSRRG